jgi:hypothetical protein
MAAAAEHVFAHVGAADSGAAIAWYARLFGREADLVPTDGEAAWRVTETAWIVVGGEAQPTGGARVTVLVDDLDALVAGLASRDIDAGEIETATGLYRRVAIADPEGNTVVFAQPFADG